MANGEIREKMRNKFKHTKSTEDVITQGFTPIPVILEEDEDEHAIIKRQDDSSLFDNTNDNISKLQLNENFCKDDNVNDRSAAILPLNDNFISDDLSMLHTQSSFRTAEKVNSISLNDFGYNSFETSTKRTKNGPKCLNKIKSKSKEKLDTIGLQSCDFLKHFFGKIYEFYWSTLLKISVIYPKVGSWL